MTAGRVAIAAALVMFATPLAAGGLLGWEYVDGYGTQWYYHHVAAALAEGRSPMTASELFHPWGKDVLRSAGGNLLDAALAAPLRWALGATLGYNLFVVGLQAGASALLFRFAHAVTRDRGAATFACLVFATDVWVLQELALGRPTQALLPLMVGYFYALWALHRSPRARHAAAVGLMLALLGYQYWYYAAFAALSGVGFGVGSLLAQGPRVARLRAYGGAAVLAAVVALPGALPLAWAAAEGTAPGLLDTARWSLARTPPLTREGVYVSLAHWQPGLGWHGALAAYEISEDSFLRTLWQPAWVPALAVASVLVVRSRLPRAGVLAAMGAAALVAVGPAVVAFGWVVPNAAYIALARAWPVWQRLWWPDRAYAVLAVLGPVGLAVGFARLPRWPRLRWALALLGVATNLAVLREADLLPFPSWHPQVEAGYRCLAAARDGAVIELPWSWSQRHLVAQAVHQRPILGGMNERDPSFAPAGLRLLAAQNAAVADLTTPFARMGGELLPWGAEELAPLSALGYRWIVFQLDALAEPIRGGDGHERSQALDRFLALRDRLGAPVYQDARMVIWAPWGHGSPCAERTPAPDTLALGRTETSLDLQTEHAIRLTGRHRLAPPP